jgi:hypothetical protein
MFDVTVDASPPPGGGFLILNKAQIGNLDLLCLIKRTYPQTKILAQQNVPADVRRVFSIGNPRPNLPGIAGYYMRREARPQEALRNAMAKLNSR